MTSWQHIPIFSVDVQGYTTYNADMHQTIDRRLHDMATEAARTFVPSGDVWSTWRNHGTGDGYYFLLIGAAPQVALHYALRLDEVLAAHNAQHGAALPLRCRGALDIGAVDFVEEQNQYRSEAFSRLARFLSHQPFKDYAGQQARPLALAITALFHTEWREDVAHSSCLPATLDLLWTPFTFHDKHNYEHRGLVLGEGWERPPATLPPRRAPGAGKLDFCRRLGTDWTDLATYLGIPLYDQARFRPGYEPQGVWEWLETRRCLQDLPAALTAIGRDDLLEDVPHPL
ncbi:MAG TPA: hypothetical protein VI542_17840 [Candidatus Tectomicrobia bacterium]